jgi:hypothetical protein
MGEILGRALAFCALAATIAPAYAADAPLGRLFFTPSQRASLDVARTQRARTALSTEKSEEATAAPVPQTLTYDGAVRRSDGKSTVFVNGRPVNEKDSAAGTIVGSVRQDGSVSLQIPQSGRSVELKPGQRVELLSGAIEESYSRKTVQPESKPAANPGDGAKAILPASSESAGNEYSKEDQQKKKMEEAIRALQEAAKAAGSPPPQVPSR